MMNCAKINKCINSAHHFKTKHPLVSLSVVINRSKDWKKNNVIWGKKSPQRPEKVSAAAAVAAAAGVNDGNR